MELRAYQYETAMAVSEAWRHHDSTMFCHPTGTGKGVILAALTKEWRDVLADEFGRSKRSLLLTHLDELVWQLAEHVEEWTGQPPGIEKGEFRVRKGVRQAGRAVVVSSIQTMMQEARRGQFPRDEFGMVGVDEFHHAVAPGWQKVINYFDAKLVGATATCDRTDEVPLGKAVDSVADHYELTDAIADGYLSPVKQDYIYDVHLDWSRVRKLGTDLSAEDLDAVLLQEDALHRLCRPVVDCCGRRQTLVFTPSVASARAVANLLDRHPGVRAEWISGATPADERRPIIHRYKTGQVQYLVSCDVLREGFDAPATSAIVILRPTLSRLVYAQMVGRGLRGGFMCPVDGKQDCLVLDLVDVCRKHKLVTCADLLGGRWEAIVTDEADRMLREKRPDVPADVMEALLAAAAKVNDLQAEQRRKIIAEAKFKRKTIDPFVIFADANNVPEERVPGWWANMLPDEHQLNRLKSLGIPRAGLSYGDARQIINEANRRARDGRPSYKQARHLRAKYFDPTMSAAEASDVLDYIANRPGGWSFVGREDGPRKALKKRRGHGVRYSELRFQFTVPAGTKCRARKVGLEFKPYTTTKVSQFRSVAKRGDGVSVFRLEDFELEVPNDGYHARLVRG